MFCKLKIATPKEREPSLYGYSGATAKVADTVLLEDTFSDHLFLVVSVTIFSPLFTAADKNVFKLPAETDAFLDMFEKR